MKIKDEAASSNKEERLLKAVLALFKAEPIAQVCQEYNICRRDLCKLRRRALVAMLDAMKG